MGARLSVDQPTWPGDGARGLFGWHVNLDPDRLGDLLADWLPRIDTQDDYNAVVDFVALAVYRRPEWIESVDPLVANLVAMRFRFAQMARTESDCERLARRQLTAQPVELLAMLLDLVDGGEYHLIKIGQSHRHWMKPPFGAGLR